MAPELDIVKDEKILCFHGPLIYEGKCIDIDTTKADFRYLVHYTGWNSRWDEWVSDDRLLKYNEENLQLQRETLRRHMQLPRELGLVVEESSDEDDDADQPDNASAVDIMLRCLKIKIPDDLKEWLVSDWDLVKNQRKLAVLPARYTVSQLIDNYIAHKRLIPEHTEEVDSLMVKSLTLFKNHFEKVLGQQLLYNFERLQFEDVQEDYPGFPVADIYGAIHLLRMFTRIEPLMANMALKLQTLEHVPHIQDFLKFVMSNRIAFFLLSDYRRATPEYSMNVR